MTHRQMQAFEIILGICCSFLTAGVTGEGEVIARRTENSPPEIVDHPDDLIVPKGSPVTLNCRADGYPTPEIRWYKNGVLLNTDSGPYTEYNNGNLFIVNVETKRSHSDDGVYQCEARNSFGVARSNNATLVVAYLKEDFRLEPSNTDSVVGGPLVLECQPPKGNPSPLITWEKDRRPLQPDGERVRVLRDGNLMISPAVIGDTGSYRCIATIEEVGSKTSSSARVEIHERPTIITGPDDITKLPGETVTLECIAEGQPPPSISWLKDGGALPEERSTAGSTSLVIRDTIKEDSGTYVCVAENRWGSSRAEAEVVVDASPRFTVRPVDQTVREGQDIEVPCQAEGSPPPALMWMREGSEDYMFPRHSEGEGKLSISADSSLIIRDADVPSEGVYICSTFSSLGMMESPMTLRVVPDEYTLPPIIQYGPADQIMAVGATARLTCQVGVSLGTDSSEVTTTWLKDDSRVVERDQHSSQNEDGTLEILSLESQDGGIYTCIVGNDVGETSWSARLQVIRETDSSTFLSQPPADPSDLPGAPGMPYLMNQTAGRVIIGWKSPYLAEPEVLGYTIEGVNTEEKSKAWHNFGDSETNRIELRNLPTETEMMFVVRARSAEGMGPPSPVSHPIIALESRMGVEAISSDLEPGLSEPPVELPWVYITGVTPLSSTTIQVMWRVDPSDVLIDGFRVQYKESSASGQWTTETVTDDSSVILNNLRGNTEYDIRVFAFSGRQEGDQSNEVKVRTFDTDDLIIPRDSVLQTKLNECGITIKTVDVLGPTEVKISWQLERNVDYIDGFYVKLQSFGNPGDSRETIENKQVKVMRDLRPWTTYAVSVQPYNGVFKGPETDAVVVRTAETAPQAPPEVTDLQPFNATAFQVRWRAPPREAVPGVILGYHIFCRSSGPTLSHQSNITITGNTSLDGIIGNLTPGQAYGVRVAAYTVAGIGPFSPTKLQTLPPALNGPTNRGGGSPTNRGGDSGDQDGMGFLAHPVVFAVVGVIFLLLLTSCLLLLWRRRRKKHTHSVNGDKEEASKENSHKLGQVSMTKSHGDPPQFKQPNQVFLRHDSTSGVSSGNYPTLSTFHGNHMSANSPEYAVVENPDGTSSPSPIPGIVYGPSVHPPNFLPVGSMAGHAPYPHHLMDDPEPYASSTLMPLPGGGTLRRPPHPPYSGDSSSDWTNSWTSQQDHRKKAGPHFDQHQLRKGSRDGGPPVPRRDHSNSGLSDQSSLYSSASSQGGTHRMPRHHLRKNNPSPANWSELMPLPPGQGPPTDPNAPPPLPGQGRPRQEGQHCQMVNSHHGGPHALCHQTQYPVNSMNIQQQQPMNMNNHELNLHNQHGHQPMVMGIHENYPHGYPDNHFEHPQQGGLMDMHRTPHPIHGYSYDGAFQPTGPGTHSLERQGGQQQQYCERCPDCANSAKMIHHHGGSFHGDNNRRNQSPRTVQSLNAQNVGAHDTRTYPGPAHGGDHFQMNPTSYQNSSPRPRKKGGPHGMDPPYAQVQQGGVGDHYSEGGSTGSSSIASQRVFADPRHAQIGQELLKYMSQEELRALAGKDSGYAPMKPAHTAPNGNPAKVRAAVSDSEMDDGVRETDFDLISNGRLSASCASLTSCNTSQCNSNCSGSEGSLIEDAEFNNVLSNLQNNTDNGNLSAGNPEQPNASVMVSRFDGSKVKPALLHPKAETRHRMQATTAGKKEDVV